MASKPEKGGGILVGLNLEPDEEDLEGEGEGEPDVATSAKKAAAKDIMSAFKKSDVDALSSALERFYEHCSSKTEEE